MRNGPVVLVAVLLGGCGGGSSVQPVDLSAPAPASTPVAMECVTRELDELGYEIVPANETAPNQVTGVRINEPPWYVQWLYGNTADQITASISQGQLRVSAISTDPEGIGREGPPATGASEAATRNAQSILETCAPGA